MNTADIQLTPEQRYLQHLDSIFHQQPQLFREESEHEGLPGVTAIVYDNYPQKGYITGLTYGLSSVKHPMWKNGRPELCISVASDNLGWARVAAHLANYLRGECPFRYRDTINFNEQVSPDSEMDAFFVFAPTVMDPKDYLNIDIGEEYRISIAGLYPMYATEIDYFEKIGLEQFWKQPGYDAYDVKRERTVEG